MEDEEKVTRESRSSKKWRVPAESSRLNRRAASDFSFLKTTMNSQVFDKWPQNTDKSEILPKFFEKLGS